MKVFPVFIPFMGCPYRCIYCNQYATTPVKGGTYDAVLNQAETAIHSLAKRVIDGMEDPSEIAFFGGTFTALPLEVMKTLLNLASPYVEKGIFRGIRFSTRPDALSWEVLETLKSYPVSTVELGVQSLDDRVLKLTRRGYGSHTVSLAVSAIRSQGWKLGIQLMPGLPGDSFETFQKSVEATCLLKPDFVRLYPTVVIRDTLLEKWYRQGTYRPLTLKEAISWCAEAFIKFWSYGIKVIRMGLQATEDLKAPLLVAGPYHPAFGYLVKVHVWRIWVDRVMEAKRAGDGITIVVPKRLVSECVGPRRINLRYWKRRWNLKEITIALEDREKERGSSIRLLEEKGLLERDNFCQAGS